MTGIITSDVLHGNSFTVNQTESRSECVGEGCLSAALCSVPLQESCSPSLHNSSYETETVQTNIHPAPDNHANNQVLSNNAVFSNRTNQSLVYISDDMSTAPTGDLAHMQTSADAASPFRRARLLLDGYRVQIIAKSQSCCSIFTTIANGFKEYLQVMIKILLIDIFPWAVGCYIIFYTFRNGGLGLGFTSFLLLVTAHGALKWWTTRKEANAEGGVVSNSDGTPSRSDVAHTNANSRRCRHQHRPDMCCHGYRISRDALGYVSSEDYTTSDDSDLDDSRRHSVSSVIANEPPPSYDDILNPAPSDLCMGLEEHFTPLQPRLEIELSDLNDRVLHDCQMLTKIIDFRRNTAKAAKELCPCHNFELRNEDCLPTYTEAIGGEKNIKIAPSSVGSRGDYHIKKEKCLSLNSG